MTIVGDASSLLILLAKIKLLEKLTESNEVITPKRVYEEVIRGKEKGREDSMILEKLVKEKKIKVIVADEKVKNSVNKLLGLKGGEQEVIALSLKKSGITLTDDKKCINAAKTLNIEFITALDVVAALYKRGKISRDVALKSLDNLEEYGWYVKDLINMYREVIK